MNVMTELWVAADKLDGLASEATAGPWTPHVASSLHTDAAAWIGAPGTVSADGVYVASTANAIEGLGDAAYIAAMNPLVGKMLAVAMREASDTIRKNVEYRGPRGLPLVNIASAGLLDLARLINGSSR